MDRINSRIAQVYGYAVCLVSVLVFLGSLNAIIGAVFNLTDPIRAEERSYTLGPPLPLTSFAAYKLASQRANRYMPARASDTGTAQSAQTAPVSDEELRQSYQTEREEKIGYVRFHAMRQLLIGVVFSLLAVVLFALHWRWLRKMNVEAMVA